MTGSAGYIGSHACLRLWEDGQRVVGIDNYSRGNRGSTVVLEQFPRFSFVEIDIRNQSKLADIMNSERIEAVMHFVAYAYVGESCEHPLMYYGNNVGGSLSFYPLWDRQTFPGWFSRVPAPLTENRTEIVFPFGKTVLSDR